MSSTALDLLHDSRPWRVGAAVLVAHGALLWALEHGLLQRSVEVPVPVALIGEISPPPPPPPSARPPAPVPAPTKPTPPPPAPRPAPATSPAPAPVPAPAHASPVAPALPAPPSPPIAAPAPVSPAAVPAQQQSPQVTVPPPPPPAQPLAPARVELIGAINTKDRYPLASLRLGESGRTTVRIWVGNDGRAKKAEIEKSSGYARLDNEAIKLAMEQRYRVVRDGVAVQEEAQVLLPFLWKPSE